MRRVLAVLAAVAMVVVAVLLRDAIDDDGDEGSEGDGELVVLCATDLAEACRDLPDSVAVLIADPAATAAELAEGTLDEEIDAWITSTAWLEVTESHAPAALDEVRAIATSPTVMATAPGRHDAIAELCGTEDIWQCLGGNAGEDWANLGDGSNAEWRELKVGITYPDVALGLPVLASAAAGYFGNTDFAANDLQSEFEGWLANLAEPSASGDLNPALTMATQAGRYSAAGSVGAIANGLGTRGVEAIEPDVAVPATIVIARLARGDGLPATDRVRDGLEELGWARASEGDLAPTLKPGVMAALHTLWRAVTT